MTDEVADPRSGQRVIFRRIDDDVLELDLFVSKGAFVREHIHPTQEETLTGVAGTFIQVVDGKTHRIGPGDSVTIPPRTPHNYDSAPEDCQLLVTVKPALELDRFFRAFLGLSRDGKLTIPEKGMPTPLVTFAPLCTATGARWPRRGSRCGSSARAWARWRCSRSCSAAARRTPSTAGTRLAAALDLAGPMSSRWFVGLQCACVRSRVRCGRSRPPRKES